MKHLAVLVAALQLTLLLHAQEWKVNLSDSVSVSTPIALHDTLISNMKVKVGGKEDHSASFTAMLLDYKSFGLTEAMISSVANTNDFKEQFKTGFLGSMPGAVIVSDTIATYHNKYTYYDFVISTVQNNIPITMYVRSLFYKALGINLYYAFPKSQKADIAEKDKFFNSIVIIE
jgi:hypothetical protein